MQMKNGKKILDVHVFYNTVYTILFISILFYYYLILFYDVSR